jgi:hypothetical protein
MRSDTKPMARRQRLAAAKISAAESLFEDDLAFVCDCNGAAGLIGLADLELDPSWDVVERRVQPAIHWVRSPRGWLRMRRAFDG